MRTGLTGKSDKYLFGTCTARALGCDIGDWQVDKTRYRTCLNGSPCLPDSAFYVTDLSCSHLRQQFVWQSTLRQICAGFYSHLQVMKNAPKARCIFDKFHIMRHLSKALDEVRRSEYKRLSGKDRSYIKGQRYTLLTRRENLSLDGRRALKKLLQANRRLNTAYVLKESFGQLWDYRTERGARTFFERWKESLKWQRLKPYRKFAGLVESHWDGIASYCHPENKVSLGLVEGINNKIRVLQRRAYGYRDEEYHKLKIVAAFLPPLPRNANINPHVSA